MRSLVCLQMMADSIGLIAYFLFGSGYASGGVAMVLTIVLDVVHSPAVSTPLSLALRTGKASDILLFALALSITTALVGLQRLAL